MSRFIPSNTVYHPPYYNKYGLPEVLNETIKGVCEPMQAQAEMGMSVVLAALATAAQGVYDVQLPFGKIVPLSLYVLVAAPSGGGKTTVANALLEPLLLHQSNLQKQYEDQALNLNAERRAWEWGLKDLDKRIQKAYAKANQDTVAQLQISLTEHLKAEPNEAVVPKMVLTDATAAATVQHLSSGLKNLCLYSSEGGITIKNWQQSFVTQANALWDGDSITVARKGSGTTTISEARMGILVLLQPEILTGMRASKALMRESGFFARFLVCEVPRNNRQDAEIKPIRLDTSYQRVMERLLQRTEQVKEGLYEKAIIICSEAANEKWKNYTHHLEKESTSDQMYGNATDFTAKVGNLLCRIAGILALFEHDGNGETVIISEQHMHCAANMMNYYLQQFMTMFDAQSNQDKLVLKAEKLMDWLKRRLSGHHAMVPWSQSIEKSEILRSGPPEVRKVSDLDEVLDYLMKTHQIYMRPEFSSANPRAKPSMKVSLHMDGIFYSPAYNQPYSI